MTVLLLLLLMVPGDTLRLALPDAVAQALEASPELHQYRHRVDYARARLQEARAHRLFPEFTLSTAHAPAPTLTESTYPRDRLYLDPDLRNNWERLTVFNQVEVKLTQPLYTWGELTGTIRAAAHGLELEAGSLEEKRLETARRTAELYYNLLLAHALHGITEETGDIIRRAKRELERLLKEGDPSVDDADLFQVQIVEQEYFARVTEVEEQLRLARAALRHQLALPEGTVIVPDTLVLLPIALELDSLETYLTLARDHRPELTRARAGMAAREALLQVARSAYYPKLYLGASGRYAYTPGRYRQPNPYIDDPLLGRSLQAGLGFRMNLNFGITRARVEEARAQLREVEAQHEAAWRLIQFEVEQAYRQVRTTREAMERMREALRISREWLRTEEINFDLELGDSEDLVRAVRSTLELEARYNLAVHRYNLAVLDLYKATGTLTDVLQHGMPIAP